MNSINQVNFFRAKRAEALNAGISINAENTNVKSFKDTMADVVSELNETMAKPEQLTNDFMQGKADVHDVMSAIAQSELSIQAATTLAGKVLQIYEKVMQITI